MTLNSRLRKLEQIVIPTGITKELFKKIGFMPVIVIDSTMKEEEKQTKITTSLREYFNKIAKELRITLKQAEELYIKSGHTGITVIEDV